MTTPRTLVETSSRPPQIRLYEDEACIDGFAGGGGTSTGIEMAIGRAPDVAINHDPVALAMHKANHPDTIHIESNIRVVRYETTLPAGKRCGFAWFSPDCTHFSKAKGGKPFRDPQRARRIRGLAWEAVRCAKAIRPRILFLENVEEWLLWGPIGKDGQPDPTRKGVNFRRWLRELQALGYQVEWRELLACNYGSPTARKRLFVIARCDGQPIVWPEPTHGPTRPQPYRTAAECIDFALPVPSIFMTQRQAKAWGKANGVAAPRRPLAKATLRRIARGIQRFVLDAPEPFIVSNLTNNVPKPVSEPLTTVLTGNHKYLVAPTLVRTAHGDVDRRGKRRGRGEHAVTEPIPTLTGSNDFAIVAPFLAKYHAPTSEGGERGQQVTEPIKTLDTANRFALIAPFLAPVTHPRDARVHSVEEPLRTITSSERGEFALIAPTLINTRNGERHGRHGEQAPRVHDIQKPMPTVTAQGSQGALVEALLAPLIVNNSETREDRAYRSDEPMRTLTAAGCRTFQLVAAFLAKHNGGHEATGQHVKRPMDTVVCRENKALVTCHLQRDFGGSVGSHADAPMPTITAGGGGHAAIVTAHLEALYSDKNGECRAQGADEPIRTVTATPRHAMVTSHLVKLRGNPKDHPNTAHDLREPLPTVTANGTHLAEVRAFLVKFYGSKKDGRPLDAPLDTLTTKDRFGLVTVQIGGEEYAIVDIGMRMLTPRELFTAQGFPNSYEIERVELPTPLGVKMPSRLTKKAQTRLVGNSVPPHVAAAIIGANLVRADAGAVA